MEIVILVLLMPVGLFIGGIGLAEVLEEVQFKKKAIRVKGYIIGKVSARYKPRVQFNGLQGYTGATESTDERSLSSYIGRIEFTTEEGVDYQVKTRHLINYDENEEVEVLYNPKKPSDAMIDSYYKIGNEKYYRLIGGLIFIVTPIAMLI